LARAAPWAGCSIRSASSKSTRKRALVDGVVDVDYSEERSYIYTEPAQLAAARKALGDAKLRIVDVYLGMRAKQTVAPEGSELQAALAFLDVLEESEDVQRVFSNLDVSDAALEALT